MCGENISIADFWIGAMYTDKCFNKENPNKEIVKPWERLLKNFPNFKRFGEDFKKENAKWLAKRPARIMWKTIKSFL